MDQYPGNCPRCGGTGYIARYRHIQRGICFRCRGTGRVGTLPNGKTASAIIGVLLVALIMMTLFTSGTRNTTLGGAATSIPPPPPVITTVVLFVEETNVPTVGVTRVVTHMVVSTATMQQAPPTVTLTATPMPVSALTTSTTVNLLSTSVVNGGNLRSETKLSVNTIIGQVCPGDRVAVLAQKQVGAALWYKVRIIATATNCDPKRVAIGTEGWLNRYLVL